eukprot:scaffold14075_cov58-Phaeocystis_antarctica.AAC.2
MRAYPGACRRASRGSLPAPREAAAVRLPPGRPERTAANQASRGSLPAPHEAAAQLPPGRPEPSARIRVRVAKRRAASYQRLAKQQLSSRQVALILQQRTKVAD